MRPVGPIVLVLVAALCTNTAWAQQGRDCKGAPSSSVVTDLRGAVDAAPHAPDQYVLPVGTLTADDLERAFQYIVSQNQGVAALFGLLADGQKHVLSGAVVRDLFKKYGVTLDFLPIDTLVDVVAENGTVTFNFDFGGASNRKVRLPDARVTVLKSRNSADPTLVDGKNKAETRESEGRELKVSRQVQLQVGPGGITGIREGDIKVGWALGWLDLSLQSAHVPGKVATQDGKTVLATDANGQPLVRDNHYVPQTFDDWILLKAGPAEVEVGIPTLKAK